MEGELGLCGRQAEEGRLPNSFASERVVGVNTGLNVGAWLFSAPRTLGATEGRAWVDIGSADGVESSDEESNGSSRVGSEATL